MFEACGWGPLFYCFQGPLNWLFKGPCLSLTLIRQIIFQVGFLYLTDNGTKFSKLNCAVLICVLLTEN